MIEQKKQIKKIILDCGNCILGETGVDNFS